MTEEIIRMNELTSREHVVVRRTPKGKMLACALGAILFGLSSTAVQAIEFSSGEWTGNFDTTLSYGASWRLKDYDPENVGKQANNPVAFMLDKASQRDVIGRWSANGDDGT